MGKRKKSKCFPALAQQTTSASTGGTLPQGTDLLALITAIQLTTMTTPTNPSSMTADDKQEKSKGTSRSELNTTLYMGVKAITGDIMDLPACMQENDTKGTIKHYNSIIIQKVVMSKCFYDDTDIPRNSPLLNMIITRYWTGKDGNINRPSLLHAM